MFLKVLQDLGADQDASSCAGFPLGSGGGMSSGGTVHDLSTRSAFD